MKALIASIESHFPDYQKKVLFSLYSDKDATRNDCFVKRGSTSTIITNFILMYEVFLQKKRCKVWQRMKSMPLLIGSIISTQYQRDERREKELLLITGSLYFLAKSENIY